MSRRRSRPSETKASARFDLLVRVILAAFTIFFGRSIFNPRLFINVAGFAATEQADPRREQPSGNKTADQNEERFPDDHRDQAIGDRAPNNRVGHGQKKEMDGADEKKPADPAHII